MQTTTKKLLDELYDLEPLLKERESEITEIIETMLNKRPTIKIDESWKKKVKEEILSTFTKNEKKEMWSIRFGSWFFPLTTAVFALLFFSTLVPSLFHWEKNSMNPSGFVSLEYKESKLGQQDAVTAPMMATSRTMMAPMETSEYRYIYTGSLDIIPEKLPVYEKKSSSFNISRLETEILGTSFEQFDMGALNNPHITTLTLAEDRPFGYMITVDSLGGNISLYPNYEKWPQLKCDQDGCETQQPLTLTDIPSEKEILSISDTFLGKYSIKGMKYASGFVDYSWKNQDENMVPEMLTIIYPILVDDLIIYEESGIPRGLTLTYDVRNRLISSLSGLEKISVQKIDHPIISDIKKLQKVISQEGKNLQYTRGERDAKITDIMLGSPIIIYARRVRTSPDGSMREYYVPSLLFKSNSTLSDTRIVPLVSEFMENEGME